MCHTGWVPGYSTTAPEPDQVDYVSLAPGIAGPPWIKLHVEDIDGYDLEARIVATARTKDRTGRYEIEKLCVLRRPDGPALSSDQLRKVAVAGLVRGAVARWWRSVEVDQETGELSMEDSRLSDEIVAKLKSAGPSDPETQAWVARTYRLALILNEPPTAAVKKALGMPRSTVSTWIAAARRSGALSPSEGRGKAVG